MATKLLSLLKTVLFLPLFITQFLGALNDNIFKNALVILITYKIATLSGENIQLLVTLAAGIFILPFFLFSAIAGELADKLEKSRLISIIKGIEIIIMIIGALGFHFKNVPLLLFVLFALGTHSTFFGPLKYSILPDHLKENELIAGNGLIEAGTFIAILLGTILGGILILYPYGEWIIAGLSITIAVMGWISSLWIPLAEVDNSNLKLNFNIFKKTYQLLHYSRKKPDIFLAILAISWFWVVGATFLSEFPIYAKDVLHAEGFLVTYFLTLFSIGLGLGSLLCNKLLKSNIVTTYVQWGAWGITIFGVDLYFASLHPLSRGGDYLTLVNFLQTFTGWRISLDLIFLAVSGGIYTVPLYAILQYRSERMHRARVIAANNVMNALFMVGAAIGIMIMLKSGFDVNQIFLITAIINAFVAIALYRLN